MASAAEKEKKRNGRKHERKVQFHSSLVLFTFLVVQLLSGMLAGIRRKCLGFRSRCRSLPLACLLADRLVGAVIRTVAVRIIALTYSSANFLDVREGENATIRGILWNCMDAGRHKSHHKLVVCVSSIFLALKEPNYALFVIK